MFTKLTEHFRSRVLLAPQTTAAAAQAYLAPTPGVKGQTYRVIVKKGNAADLVLKLRYADDTAGTNATDFPVDARISINGLAFTSGKDATVTGANGNFIVDICVDPGTIPQGKLVGLSYDISHASTLLSAELVEDVAYRPTVS